MDKVCQDRKEKAVIIDISDIISCENREVTKEVQLELTSFVSRLGRFPITEKAPVFLRIANQDNRRLLIRGSVDVTVQIPCGRCLAEVFTLIRFEIDKEFKISDSAICGEEAEETDYLTGNILDVEKLIYGEILVNWPTKVLCSEDCKGICKTCGRNLNEGECGCSKTEPDLRMAAFQDVFNKFKEV